jgi:hypothetical protein
VTVLNLVQLEQKGAGLSILEPEFCTSTDTGRILVTVLGMPAEMERRFILEVAVFAPTPYRSTTPGERILAKRKIGIDKPRPVTEAKLKQFTAKDK